MAVLPPFAEMVREHQSMVYSLAYHCLGSHALAEDLAQEVFFSLHQHMHRLESPEHVRFWLRQVTSRRCIDEARRRKLRPTLALEHVPEPSEERTPADPFLQAELRRQIAALPPQARMVVVMRYQEEMDPAEIAEAMRVPLNTVKTRLHRALKVLRSKLVREKVV